MVTEVFGQNAEEIVDLNKMVSVVVIPPDKLGCSYATDDLQPVYLTQRQVREEQAREVLGVPERHI